MQEKEMLNCLLAVWENMTEDKDREAYKEMLVLLDNMRYFLRHDLQIEYELPPLEVKAGTFTFKQPTERAGSLCASRSFFMDR